MKRSKGLIRPIDVYLCCEFLFLLNCAECTQPRYRLIACASLMISASASSVVNIRSPSNYTSLLPGDIQLQVCVSSEFAVSPGDLAIFKNGQALSIDWSSAFLRSAVCNNLFEAVIQISPGQHRLQATVKSYGSDQSNVDYSLVTSVVAQAKTDKRFLFMLHVPSLWRLADVQRKFVTSDSDLITLVCPPAMSPDEEHAYNSEEEIAALELFSSCNHESLSSCLYPRFGNVTWHRNCSRDHAELMLISESKQLLPYSFYIFVQDENLLSLALIFEENYARPSHRSFMSRFSRHRTYQRLQDAAQLDLLLGSPAQHARHPALRSAVWHGRFCCHGCFGGCFSRDCCCACACACSRCAAPPSSAEGTADCSFERGARTIISPRRSIPVFLIWFHKQ
jgi:hypothetical protein